MQLDYRGASRRGQRRDYGELEYEDRPTRSRSRSRSRSPSGSRSPRYKRRRDDGYDSDTRSGRRRRSPRSRSVSPERVGDLLGTPNTDVMLQGLDPDLAETDLLSTIANLGGKVDKVIIIRDRNTKLSRGFGFARFLELQDACTFVENNYPTITCKSSRIRIAYSKERNEGDNGWICKFCDIVNYPRRMECYKCFAARKGEIAYVNASVISYSDASTDGLDAIGGTAPTSSIRLHHKQNDGSGDIGDIASQFLMLRGLNRLTTEENIAKAMSELALRKFRRVLLVRDRVSKASWSFAFVEYASAADCTKVVEFLHKQFPSCSPNSTDSDNTANADRFAIDGADVTASFIHSGVFVPAYATNTDELFTFLAANGSTRLMYWDENAYVGVYVEPSSQQDDVSAFFADIEGSSRLTRSTVSNATIQDDKPRKKKEVVQVSKKMAPQLQRWQKKQAELHGTPAQKGTDEDDMESTAYQESFADAQRPACLLCLRKFNAFDEVNRHERLSALHKHNLADEQLCEKARLKVTRAKEKAQNAYRDRARERRVAQNQTNKRPDIKSEVATKAKEEPVEQVDEESDDDMFSSKGSKLLEKMGWKSGSGLGANESGISQPIKPEMYAQGVGLGVEGSRLDAEKEGMPSTYDGFVKRVRESARERFEKLE
ncbi:hypothetical protein POJ06DRAFT_54050 [Lipomyces tetrasporus]|uniref:RNA-binding protein n=1 Tax=Lipomyces tetrasporus TaxID=54092 RepID=A0AAD7VV80_9ASCO|nr:uncharacterized protein POJ06DRAFT_54050 [Lipomyces tetrasporus]KAJ8102701.1 hypothetical protein POJ06DRAFT_54050 [Lipomyces tetrasporus]